MIHPSYVDLMKVVNQGVEEGEQPVINSRYSVVMATAKRARQIIAGDEPMVRVKDKQKPLSIAVDEMNQAQLRILTDEEKEALLASAKAAQAEDAPVEETTENE
ncbi:MAG: DNA-directed RNA polymerase subunit omega [Butyrivibrio sp.]|nr:DNA-directed RNA polymerase subunit omega [Butyrivibrio sp.]